MAVSHDVVILGAGAAGVGAGRRLAQAGASFVLLEARARIGGRTLTLAREAPLDIGAAWLHSGDRNVLTALAEANGFEVDRTPAPWQRQTLAPGLSAVEQAAFGEAFRRFEQRIETEAERDGDKPASAYLEPDGRWNAMLSAVFTYISSAELERIDARDYARYEDSGVNWRVRAGYGALVAALGAGLPVRLETEVLGVDHSGALVRIDTSRGAVEARAAIVTLPTSRLGALAFTPDLPGKREAALALPLGAAEKVHFALAQAEEFPIDGRLFARTDRFYVKEYEADSNANFSVLLDVSASMGYGSRGATKLDYARVLAACLTYLVHRQRDRVGLVAFDTEIVEHVPPSAKHMEVVLHVLDRLKATRPGALRAPLHRLAEHFGRRGILVLISDLYAEPEEVFGVCGAAPLYRLAMLEDVRVNGQVFAESFFLYLEDVDLDLIPVRRVYGSRLD